MPDEAEVAGLLALMLLQDARRAARVRDGELVLLADQDRALWDAGRDRRKAASRSTGRSRSAAAARTCCRRRSRRCTPRTSATAARSRRSTASSPVVTGSPVVELNRAVAVAEAGEPADGLELLDDASTSTATATSTRRAASCCGGSAARKRRGSR